MTIWLVWWIECPLEPDCCPLAGVFSTKIHAESYIKEFARPGRTFSIGSVVLNEPMFHPL